MSKQYYEYWPNVGIRNTPEPLPVNAVTDRCRTSSAKGRLFSTASQKGQPSLAASLLPGDRNQQQKKSTTTRG
ncbi:hypothetical protein CpipJ_CPIJ002357 [Culex quinquefasciatus]|uniref:Uncharacterized protein n=1 Tax=Culex quinquefasciatus TaxID=7176 RepID=B0W5W7_CULQU|nr:hypothetical protein CpipJ_CPIJ002357 [Culex quinquefasciatus]|eukprot:XP_001844101.1 hypothetical protein CpipJ_CPIJ002357 [Culex quinquefasciatus]